MKHYDATKDMTGRELEMYLLNHLQVGDTVRALSLDCVVIAKTSDGYFWVREKEHGDSPMTVTVRNMDIREGM